MHRFFSPEDFQSGKEYLLSPEQSHHLVKVVRLREGAEVELFNGKGKAAHAQVIEAHGKRSRVQVLSVRSAEPLSQITLAFGLPKATALDFVIHRATEVGVAGFQPLITEHSLGEKSWNVTRWERVVTEVCKQCQADVFPRLYKPMRLMNWLEKRDSQKGLLFCNETQRKQKTPQAVGPALDVLVGPEGGWSQQEISAVEKSGAMPFSLGPQRLRMETASLVALTLAKALNGEV